MCYFVLFDMYKAVIDPNYPLFISELYNHCNKRYRFDPQNILDTPQLLQSMTTPKLVISGEPPTPIFIRPSYD